MKPNVVLGLAILLLALAVAFVACVLWNTVDNQTRIWYSTNMNKNTKRRVKRDHAAQKAVGFPKPVYRRKTRSFPQPNKEANLSLKAQAEIFYGANYASA